MQERKARYHIVALQRSTRNIIQDVRIFQTVVELRLKLNICIYRFSFEYYREMHSATDFLYTIQKKKK